MEDKYITLTIDKVKFIGKWVEYWFTDGDLHNGGLSYHASSKGYKLMALIDKAEIYNDVMSNGLKGKKMKWELIGGYNYEPIEIIIESEKFDNRD